MATTLPRKGRLGFLRFGLRSLLGLVTLVALGLGAYRMLVVPHRKQRDFLAAAEKTNVQVTIRRWWSGDRLAWTSDLEVGLLDRMIAVDFSRHHDSTPQAAEELVALLSGLPGLGELDLSGLPVSDVACDALELPALRKLTLRDCQRVEVLHLPRLPSLEELDAGASSLRALYCDGIPRLRSADLSRTRVTRETLVALAGLRALRELDVSNTPLNGAAMAALPASLEELRIDHTVLDEPGVDNLRRLPALKQVGLGSARTVVEQGQESRLRQALGAGVSVGSRNALRP